MRRTALDFRLKVYKFFFPPNIELVVNAMIEDIEINDVRSLTQIVKEKYDYDFSNYAISSFKRRLIRILEVYKFDTFDKLLVRIKSDPVFFRDFLS